MADTKMHKPYCKCLRCKVGFLDKSELNRIPLIGECQKCHKVISPVVPGEACPKCGFKG